MSARIAAWLTTIGLFASIASGEEKTVPLTSLAPGDSVRLQVSGSQKTIRATLDGLTDDEMVIRPKNAAEPMRVSLSQLRSLEVVTGRRSHWKQGALIGFVPGALLVGAAIGTGVDCYRDCPFDPTLGAIGGIFGGIVTGSVGALVGLAIRTDRFARVDARKPKVDLILTPGKGRMGVGLVVAF